VSWSSAALVILLVVLQFAPAPGTISGTVIKAGTTIQQPLRNARLELTGDPGTIVTRTDASGRFAFSSLAAGEYRLTVTCDGFIRQESPNKIVLGLGRQAANIVFELDAAPTVVGWVLDSYGEPLANIAVEALRRSYDVRGNPRLTRAATALTDDRGEYRIFWLDPGEYFFYATSPLPEATELQPTRVVAPTYFPGVGTPDDAKALRLAIGRELRVDFRLRRDVDLWTVNGQTLHAVTGRSIGATLTLTPPAQDPSFSRYRGQSSAAGPSAGQFSIGKVVPGSYILTAKSGSGDQEITTFQRIVLRPLPVTPTFGYVVTVTLSPPRSLDGRLFVDSSEVIDLRDAGIALKAVDPDRPSPRSVSSRSDGQFVLNGVAEGTYVLEVSNLPNDLYLKAARFGNDDILEKPLTLETRQAANPLQILLGADGGRMQVAAYNSKGELHPGAELVLVPDAIRRARRDQYRVVTSGENGQALLRGIPPGSYKLFAWESREPNSHLNADYLAAYESFGAPVRIASGNNPPASARLIPKE
jgi:hypothetical protein